jgi:outer membrane protein OmpA-like peptidoglycan-associated protein
MRPALLITALWLAALAGCASNSKPKPTPVVVPSTAPAATAPAPQAVPAAPASTPVPPRPTLAAEQRRLAELFKGTPVVFSMQADGSMRVEVPLSFCFGRGAFVVKPPLAAVLDRLARSQRGDTTRLRVSAAGDTATSGANLAHDRAASTRDYMVARGVFATRVTLASGAPGDGVEIVVSEVTSKR